MRKPVEIDGQLYLAPSWDDMGEVVLALAKKILSDKELRFDRVVALAKGGLSWNRQLLDFLEIKQTSSIQVRLYTGIKETAKRPIVVQALPVTIENEDVLVFDDVSDTGESLAMAVKYLDAHGAKSMKTATMFEKPWTNYHPDYFGAETNAWIIFPHDAIETMRVLSEKWGVDKLEERKRFTAIGIAESIINFYLA